jgi:hypothetical protein
MTNWKKTARELGQVYGKTLQDKKTAGSCWSHSSNMLVLERGVEGRANGEGEEPGRATERTAVEAGDSCLVMYSTTSKHGVGHPAYSISSINQNQTWVQPRGVGVRQTEEGGGV